MTPTLNILRDARTLLDSHEKWTKGAFARDSDGRAVCYDSVSACCWCLEGAVAYAEGVGVRTHTNSALYELSRDLPARESIYTFNDQSSRTHAEVLALLDTTIARLEAKT
jgi:hypothetical protein